MRENWGGRTLPPNTARYLRPSSVLTMASQRSLSYRTGFNNFLSVAKLFISGLRVWIK